MPKSASQIPDILPLREPTFFILLSLAAESKHGYAILKDIEDLSQGQVKLSTGTLYEAIARLLDQALIERVPGTESVPGPAGEPPATHPGKPRKAYRLTGTGRRVLEAETHRMSALVSAAHRRLGEERG
jgi:DNA-binding PadR family transcriptional regulator